MFSKTLDSKKTYFIDNETEVVDLADTIFNPNVSVNHLYTMYKVSKEYNMRPDLLSKVLYGTTDYTEMILKYSMINNPFAIEEGDLIFAASMTSVYQAVKDTEKENTLVFDAVKNFHKYIDKNKVPSSAGSDKVQGKSSYNPDAGYYGSGNGSGNGLGNNGDIGFGGNGLGNGLGNGNNNGIGRGNGGPVEANLTKTGDSGITVKDGKVYFGSVEDSVASVDSPIVDCAVNGTTLGEFLNATLRNQ